MRTIVNEFAELYDWYKDGRYKPYEHEKLVDLLLKLKINIYIWY